MLNMSNYIIIMLNIIQQMFDKNNCKINNQLTNPFFSFQQNFLIFHNQCEFFQF